MNKRVKDSSALLANRCPCPQAANPPGRGDRNAISIFDAIALSCGGGTAVTEVKIKMPNRKIEDPANSFRNG